MNNVMIGAIGARRYRGLTGLNYNYYKDRSLDYLEGEIAHTERSMKTFIREGNKAEAEDRKKHALKLWEIYYSKKNSK